MGGEGCVKYLRKSAQIDRIGRMATDGSRWRWWLLYCLSEQEVFPGLVAEGLKPLKEDVIIKEVYAGVNELSEGERVLLWRREKKELMEIGVLKGVSLNGSEFLWNVDYHIMQDRYSRRSTTTRERFYSSFLKLRERERPLYLALLSGFEPLGIDLTVFSIPMFGDQFVAYANGRLPLFDSLNPEQNLVGIRTIVAEVTSQVQRYVLEQKKGERSETHEIVTWYCDQFRLRTGKPYAVGGKDFKLVSECLKLFSTTELQKMAERFLREDDKYAKKAGFTIGVFKCCINRLVSTKERRTIGAEDYNRPISM